MHSSRSPTSNTNLQSALTQLSTGKRINSGADDPAGLIASQALAGDITNTQQAISNSQMASKMISTADSSLAQVSSLLTTIQGLVNQAASTGNMSASAIAANQQVIDSSLDAINRISQTTSFQGQNLLDGSLAFTTTGVPTSVSGMQITQANLGTAGSLGVGVNISTAATGAFLKTDIPAFSNSSAAPATGTTSAFADGGNLHGDRASNGPQYNGVHLVFETDASTPAADPQATYNSAAKEILVKVNDLTATTDADVVTAINKTGFTALASAPTDVVDPAAGKDFGSTGLTAGLVRDSIAAGLANGANGTGGLTTAVEFQLTGSNGSQVFSFAAGTDASTMATTINLAAEQTGVYATTANTNTLELQSTNPNDATSTVGYGSTAKVEVDMLGGTLLPNAIEDVGNNTTNTSAGTDAVGTINGVTAVGSANTLSVDNSNLALSMTVAPNTSGAINFTITGGGAVFQIGPTVGTNQQAHLGLSSVNTNSLGGATGTLYDLYSNGSASLATDPTTAAQIVNEAVDQVTSLRGQLGGFQSATLDSNISSLTSAVTNLTSAKSSISDADFAAESAALTQAQVLVQSGTAVLSIANHAPENVLTLLK